MGISQVNYRDFVVFNFKCMIKTRVEFDNKYFEKLILKLNEFCQNFLTWLFVTETDENEDVDLNVESSISIAEALNKNSHTFICHAMLTEQRCIQKHVKRLR